MTSPLARLFAVTLALTTLAAAPAVRAQDAPPAEDAGTATASATGEASPDLAAEQRAAEGQPEPNARRAPAPDPDARPVDSLSHRYQLGLRVGAGVDGRFSIQYGNGPSCGTAGESFCRRIGTGLLDLELGFGLSDKVELSVLGRFGLADDAAAQARPLMLGLGVRAYGSPHAMTKLFFGARAMLDLTSSEMPKYKSIDVGLRGEFGVIVDVLRYLGIYAQLGVGIHILNALNFIGDVTGGIQARIP
jgi:hypothetical protein